jgi:hypothetical protein
LEKHLKATLSETKTKITNIHKKDAHFLGFSLIASKTLKIGRKKMPHTTKFKNSKE